MTPPDQWTELEAIAKAATGLALVPDHIILTLIKQAREAEEWRKDFQTLANAVAPKGGSAILTAEKLHKDNATLRALLDDVEKVLQEGKNAVNCAYEQAHNEFHGHDIKAGLNGDRVDKWRKSVRDFLSRLKAEKEKEGGR